MAVCARPAGTLLRITLAGFLAGAGLVGCQKADSPPAQQETPAPTAQTDKASPDGPGRLSQPFAEATCAYVPDQVLPAKTMTGKSVAKVYEKVVKLWGEIRFEEPPSKKIYLATVVTEMGPFDIQLNPELAPNHVRNFIALAQAGYYNGLVFERALHEMSDDNNKLELIEGGCPMGTGDPGLGSIGYWLKPEFSDDVHHEAGSVGAYHGELAESAACRFYVTLGPAPVMDGAYTVFGKVVRGMDVVQKIATQPVLNASEYPDGDRPQKPIVIQRVQIQIKDVEKPAAKGDNKKKK